MRNSASNFNPSRRWGTLVQNAATYRNLKSELEAHVSMIHLYIRPSRREKCAEKCVQLLITQRRIDRFCWNLVCAVGAPWVRAVCGIVKFVSCCIMGLVIETENVWCDGRLQVAMHSQVPPFYTPIATHNRFSTPLWQVRKLWLQTDRPHCGAVQYTVQSNALNKHLHLYAEFRPLLLMLTGITLSTCCWSSY